MRATCTTGSRPARTRLGVRLFGDDGDDDASAEIALTVAIPGLTLPWSQVGFLWLAIVVSVTFHEFGHSLAAASFKVATERVGFFVLAFVCPGAFVELREDSAEYERLTPRQKLFISCAGIWHNVVLCMVVLLLAAGLPIWFSPWFEAAEGVVVLSLDASLAALGSYLAPGTIVFGIDSLAVTDVQQWQDVLVDLAGSSQAGYCLPTDVYQQQWHQHRDECCNSTHADAQRYQCFDLMENVAEQDTLEAEVAGLPEEVCASARELLMQPQPGRCNSETAFTADETRPVGCDTGHVCVLPRLMSETERVFVVHTLDPDTDERRQFVFAGEPGHLLFAVDTTASRVRQWARGWMPANAVEVARRALLFIVSVSASLALLNSAPIHYADGAVSLQHICDWWYPGDASKLAQLDRLLNIGTGLLLLNLFFALVRGIGVLN